MTLSPEAQAKMEELRPKDIHFRPECDSDLFKCGAHVSWKEGFQAGYAFAREEYAVQKVYRVWTNSHHHLQYTFGYFIDKERAEKAHANLQLSQTAASPENGVEEITLVDQHLKESDS